MGLWKGKQTVTLNQARRQWLLLQLRILSFGLHEDRDVGISVFPQGEKVLIGLARGDLIARHRQGAAQLPRFGPRLVVILLQLLRQIIRDTHLANRVQLRLQPVDVVLFVHENLFGQLARGIVALGHA